MQQPTTTNYTASSTAFAMPEMDDSSSPWMAQPTQVIDPLAFNGASMDFHTLDADLYGNKSAGFAQNFTEAAAVLRATPLYPRCVHCMQCFDPAANGPFACAVPHSAPIHTLIAGDKALYPAIYLPCCDKGRLNMPGLHPPLNPVCRLDYHRPIIPLPFGGQIHPPQAGWTPPSPAAANSPALNGPGLVVGWQA
ncbi:uncharacterized protein TRAVEDRAFT_51717 [Trametes versicolor FP-101664 SS1]|uniref:uncharacterized protein n=1 Tax=Trametes versicolor (strain FP-101664) TaxID=717944 RepID=UPI00046221CC|nr:uncharacterized protein TRAVEDRAFT_51717 [Trametes versicolor FP-101664 SS1]EIW53981.1 hypothetical protein TRAVEDRAFT_51717 [Trametes versicolor FP-101664 SS1]